MFRKIACVGWLLLPAVWLQTAAAESLPPAIDWIPQQAALILEVNQPRAVLDLVLGDQLNRAITSSSAYRQQAADPEFRKFVGLVQFISAQLGSDWKTAIRQLTGGGVTVAMGAGGHVVLILDAQDAAMLRQLHETLLGFAKDDAAKHNDPQRVNSSSYQDVTLWTFGGDEAHAIIGNRLLVTNRVEALKAVLDVRAGSREHSVASLPGYQAARKAVGPQPAAWIYANLAAVKQDQKVQKALAEQGSNPYAALVAGGLLETVRQSDWAAAAVEIAGSSITLKLVAEGRTSGSALTAFAAPTEAGTGALPNLVVPRQIAAASFYRDLHAFYANKEKLFPERTGLILFENMMGIFFSGRDLTEEVLGETKPEIRIVVAGQEYKSGAVPQVKTPAFAVVFRIRHPEDFHEVALEAWQKAVGLANTTRGQKGQPGLIFDTTTHNDVRFNLAYYSATKKDTQDPLGSRFNTRPTLAVVGEYMILGSAEGLTRDLIDALKQETAAGAKPLAGTSDLVEVDAAQVAAALADNRAILVRQQMLEKAYSQQEAQTAVEVLITLVDRIGKARLQIDTPEGHTQATLSVQLNLP